MGRRELAGVMEELIGGHSLRSVADMAEVSHTVIYEMLRRGHRPRYETFLKVVQALEREGLLPGDARARLFTAAGFPDPAAQGSAAPLRYEPVHDEVDIALFKGAAGLPPEDIRAINDVIRAYLAEKRRQRGLG